MPSSAFQPMPRLWNCSSVKLQPTWHEVHLAFFSTTSVLKSSSVLSRSPNRTMPRFWLSERALLSPALYLSYWRVARQRGDPLERGDRLGQAVERHVGAEDLLELLGVSGIFRSRSMICWYVCLPISIGFCDRPLRLALERRRTAVPEHRLAVDRVENCRGAAAASLALDPVESGRPSVQPLAGLWQVAQLTVPLSETRGSK